MPANEDADIEAQLARRDAYRRKLAMLKTPQERMRDMAKLQERMWAILRSNPEGYAHFLRRNHKARAISIQNSNAR
ncbi:MAG TPA: hypothetical protein VL992_08340 [Tepidisphaeraceae bacterium]|nr:hypothetical protein [Tepidisphaeraceae bacterium]